MPAKVYSGLSISLRYCYLKDMKPKRAKWHYELVQLSLSQQLLQHPWGRLQISPKRLVDNEWDRKEGSVFAAFCNK